jgi:Protein of unknown function (DUF2975)
VFKLSFFDKKDLTNGIDWFILCAMNANEISPKNNVRFNRIQTISSFIRVVFMLLMVFYGSIVLFYWLAAVNQLISFREDLDGRSSVYFLWFLVIQIGKVIQFWMAFRLFTCFVRSGLFAAQSVGWLRRIGVISMLIWFFGLIFNFPLAWRRLDFDHIRHMPAMQQLIDYVGFAMSVVGYNTDLLAGFLLLFIAWIMDEGRKIQEEQELTV